ncbi:MAG: hypothetical protein CVU08_14590 [Bacteroidetes bacterium HGW-Bacteroidetes-3]|jgi:hypothetical protein|nr:MAG: hypothetical protein CVU08_14590 [Bacteroidetes bacterium HGW-Bacteroidetes-3]
MVIFWRNFKNNRVKNGYLGLPAFSVGVPAEKAVGLYVPNFFRKKAQKGFPLQSLTQLEIKVINPKSVFNSLTARSAKEYAKIAKHFK